MSVSYSMQIGSNLGYGEYRTVFGFYLKFPEIPTDQTTLLDYNGGSNLFVRCSLTPAATISMEVSFYGYYQEVDLCAGNPLGRGVWYWITGTTQGIGSDHCSNCCGYEAFGNVIGPGGASVGGTPFSPGGQNIPYPCWTRATIACELGIGVSLTSAYAPFPNAAGWEMSKLVQMRGDSVSGLPNSGPTLFSPLNSDATGNAFGWAPYTDFTFMARQPSGPASDLLDWGMTYSTPGAPTLGTSGSSSGLSAGSWTVGCTWVGGTGETTLGTTAAITITSGQSIVVTPPAFPTTATSANVYLAQAPGGSTLGLADAVTTSGGSVTLSAPGGSTLPPTRSGFSGVYLATVPPGGQGLTIVDDGPFP